MYQYLFRGLPKPIFRFANYIQVNLVSVKMLLITGNYSTINQQDTMQQPMWINMTNNQTVT